MREKLINGILVMFLTFLVLLAARMKAADELKGVEVISQAEYKAAVGPLLDSIDAMCGGSFNAKRHQLTFDAKGEVNGCEERGPKVAAK